MQVPIGACVECTVATESEACGTHSCNPKLNTCTNVTRDSVVICGNCSADSECIGGTEADAGSVTARCVDMNFGKQAQPEGGYCLRSQSAGCAAPYTALKTASSVSGAEPDKYCDIDETSNQLRGNPVTW